MEGTQAWGELATNIRVWGKELGFAAVGIADTELTQEGEWLRQWLANGFHGSMDYMARHGAARATPSAILPGTLRVISVRLNYLAANTRAAEDVLADPGAAYISRYALGRDYHKVLRQRLQRLGERIEAVAGPHVWRAFTDSAPVMEVALARKAGTGWRGKHTLLLTREAGSMFFLGEIYTALPLPVDAPQTEHCGTCTRCIEACPTGAIVAPGVLDARRCISYLTIEHSGPIPVALRAAIGNRIYGCDDCQLVCPWNKNAEASGEPDFQVRHGLDDVRLTELFAWSAQEFEQRFAGSAIRRIGHEQWLRNIAVALGNALASAAPDAHKATIRAALEARMDALTPLVQEHACWALAQR
jgi:epoxyqueuosine reductase